MIFFEDYFFSKVAVERGFTPLKIVKSVKNIVITTSLKPACIGKKLDFNKEIINQENIK